MTVGLLISTYNRPDALELVLQSVAAQTSMPDEIVICDDGSGVETQNLVKEWQKRLPIKYVWQEDRGFRLAASRNKGVAAMTSDYIVQIDGDIILEKHFIADHRRKATRGFYVNGSRVRLNPKATEEMTTSGKFKPIGFFSRGLLRDRDKNFRCAALGLLMGTRYHRHGNAQGCHMAFWRDDFLSINGYDENFEGWGCEDTDLSKRLEALGVCSFKLLRMAQCWHLWHKETPNPKLADAYEYMKENLAKGIFRCKRGIHQHIK